MPPVARAFVELVALLEQLQRDAVAEMSATGDAWRKSMLLRRTATHIVIGQSQALTRKIRCWLTRPEDVEPLDNAEALAEELATWKPDRSLPENSGREFDKLAQRLPRVKKRLLDLQAKVQATCGTPATHAELLAKAKERRQEIDLDGDNDAALAGHADWLRSAWPRLFEIGANDQTHPCLRQEWLCRVPLLYGQRLEGLNPVDVRDAYSLFIERMTAGLEAKPNPPTPAVQAAEPVAAAQLKPDMTVKEANDKAKKVAKEWGCPFFNLSLRKQARLIGCHPETWKKTTFYQTALEQGKIEPAKPRAPKTVSFTAKNEEATGVGEKDEVQKEAAERELQRLIANDPDAVPSPLTDDPPGRPRKVHHRKRL